MGKYSVNKLPSDILISIAQNASKLRKELGLSQLALAEKSGVSYGSIKRFEQSGKISLESLLKLAEALNRLDEFENLFKLLNMERIEKLFNS